MTETNPNADNVRKPSSEEISEALIFKEQGNDYFKQNNYEEAIAMYTLAIVLLYESNPTSSIYHSNKSRCHFNLRQFEESLKEAEESIKLDEKNIKAHYLAAESLVEISEGTKDKVQISKALEGLKRSLTLCPSQGKGEFERNFVDKIYKAKKKLWIISNEEEQEKKRAVRKYLVHLVETDSSITEENKDELNEKILELLDNQAGKDFSKVQQALICPITSCLLKDPVCNEHGNSYSREAYFKEIEKNGGKDPISQKPLLRKGILYPNINVKKAIEIFLEENPWAYDEVMK